MYLNKKNAEIVHYFIIVIYAVLSTYYTHNSLIFIGFTFATCVIRTLASDFSKKEIRKSINLMILGSVLGIFLF